MHARGIQCGILTNGSKNQFLYEKLNVAKICWPLIAGIWCCEDGRYKKPDPRALAPILSNWGNEEIVYFADAYTDYQMCLAAGVPFVQVLSGKDTAINGCQTLKSVGDLQEFLLTEHHMD